MKSVKKWLLFILFISSFIQCNTFEKRYVGKYKISKCQLKSMQECGYDKNNCILELKSNHTFELHIMDTFNLKGSWKYYDTGDNAIIELIDDSTKIVNQCYAGEVSIMPLNPPILLKNDSLESFEFIMLKE